MEIKVSIVEIFLDNCYFTRQYAFDFFFLLTNGYRLSKMKMKKEQKRTTVIKLKQNIAI